MGLWYVNYPFVIITINVVFILIFLFMSPQAMTEKDSRSLDVFARQALIGGEKVPVLWGLLDNVGTSLQKCAIGEYLCASHLLLLI